MEIVFIKYVQQSSQTLARSKITWGQWQLGEMIKTQVAGPHPQNF